MKRISTIVMALALVLSLSQCKKNEQNNAENQGEAVTITLDVSGATSGSATDGSRVIVNPATGTVNFENNDQIIVASGGKYVGTLTYNGTLFTGAISNATEGYPLQFYFLGNVTPAETLTSGVTESCSVVISDQTEHLPVISAAPSNENYVASTTDYTAHLLNKCALVKFNVTTASEAATYVTGFNNKVMVNFSENALVYSQERNGIITLPVGSGEKWAILLPQEALEAGEQGSAYSQGSIYTGTRGAVPTITENGYLTTGIEVIVTTEVNSGETPVGAISGKFTINADGDQVFFSQGNLQYQASSNIWRFAENQWDCVGMEGNSNASPTYDGWIDAFAWGTSGYNHGAVCYQPWSRVSGNDNYFAYGNWQYNLYDQTGKADWGYNPISNGGDYENSGWRTPTVDEWDYLFNTRNTISGVRFAMATVNNMRGVILLPDYWATSYYSLNNTNIPTAGFESNIINASQWSSALEQNGAVFLPNAPGFSDRGSYWSSSYCDWNSSYFLWIFNTIDPRDPYCYRSDCFAVRLVRNAE